jgi:hypothetical protein
MRAATCLLMLAPAVLAAQTPSQRSAAPDPRPAARALRIEQPLVIDGKLDESVWAGAPAVTGFIQHEPLAGTPATERTEVWILYDREALYIGARLHDAFAAGIIRGEIRRDADLTQQDAFVIVLDTYHDRQNGFVFGTTPAGIEHDGQVTKEGEGGFGGPTGTGPGTNGQTGTANLNWDGTWKVATSVDSAGWTAEFRIPFETLRYGGGRSQTWGLNLARFIRRKNEEDFWSPVPRQNSIYRISEAGTLEGVEPPARRVAVLTPSAVGSLHRDYVNAPSTDAAARFGADAKLGVTPSLTLDLTYNTDFAQVEVDEQQINLTRFNLFFPEKRPFFLENAGTFAVGTPESVELFFSRRIGIGADNREVPLLGGGRLTGKAGGFTLGLLDLETERERAPAGPAIPPDNFAVLRVLRELSRHSRVGVIAVNRLNTDSSGDYNLTLGADGRLGLGDHVSIDAYAAHSETPSRSGASNAVNLSGSYATPRWEVGLAARQVDTDFNPEVGFLERPSFRFWSFRILRHLRTPHLAWFRETRPHITFRQYDDTDGRPQSRLIHIDSHFLFANGAFFEAPGLNFTREAPRAPFEISPGVVLQPGIYDWFEWISNYNTNLSARYSVGGTATLGGFYTGHHRALQANFTARPNEKFNAGVRLGYEDVVLREGGFERVLVGLKLAYAFTPRIYLQSLVQHNNQAHNLSANIRFGWLGPAGTGLFLVYNEGRETGANARQLDRAFVVKFTRQLNLGGDD